MSFERLSMEIMYTYENPARLLRTSDERKFSIETKHIMTTFFLAYLFHNVLKSRFNSYIESILLDICSTII